MGSSNAPGNSKVAPVDSDDIDLGLQLVLNLDLSGAAAVTAAQNAFARHVSSVRALEGLKSRLEMEARTNAEASVLTKNIVGLMQAGVPRNAIMNIPGPLTSTEFRSLWRQWVQVALLRYNHEEGKSPDNGIWPGADGEIKGWAKWWAQEDGADVRQGGRTRDADLDRAVDDSTPVPVSDSTSVPGTARYAVSRAPTTSSAC